MIRSPESSTLPIRVRLVDYDPAVWRLVTVDADARLGTLRSILRAVLDAPDCTHHIFTDTPSAERSSTRRLWGDRWTMIDFRDPSVIDEETVTIGEVLGVAGLVYYAHTCGPTWLAEIQAAPVAETAILPDGRAQPPSTVIAGEGRSPLSCTRGAHEHLVAAGVLADGDHPEHATLRAAIDRAVGPWTRFDTDRFDVVECQHAVDASNERSGRTRVGGRWLTRIEESLPPTARSGFRAHARHVGLDLPPLLTVQEASAVTMAFAWVLTRAAEVGIVIHGDDIDEADLRDGTEALGRARNDVAHVIDLARRCRLLHRRSGALRTPRRLAAAAHDPLALWTTLASDTIPRIARGVEDALWLLAIADGSLERAAGPERLTEAIELSRRTPAEWWDGECTARCECPPVGGCTWHDVVARVIRSTTFDAAGREGVPVAARHPDDADLLGFDPRWSTPSSVSSGVAASDPWGVPQVASGNPLLLELFGEFGLRSHVASDGAAVWRSPDIARNLAAAALHGRSHY